MQLTRHQLVRTRVHAFRPQDHAVYPFDAGNNVVNTVQTRMNTPHKFTARLSL